MWIIRDYASEKPIQLRVVFFRGGGFTIIFHPRKGCVSHAYNFHEFQEYMD